MNSLHTMTSNDTNAVTETAQFQALIVEDDPDFALIIQRCLQMTGEAAVQIRHAETLKQAIKELGNSAADVVLLDLNLPDSLGLDTVRAINNAAPEAAIIVLTSTGGDDIARLMLRGGAQDFITKDEVDARFLKRSISYALERKRADRELRASKSQVQYLRMSHDAILRATPAALASLRKDWTVVWANDAMQQLFRAVGRPGTSLRDLFPSDESFAEYTASARLRTAETLPDRRELVIPVPDGQPCICELSLVRLNPEETTAGYLATVVDITDRAMAEQQRESLIHLAQSLSRVNNEQELARTLAVECTRVFHYDAFWFSRYSPAENSIRHVWMEDTPLHSINPVAMQVSLKAEILPNQPRFANGRPRLLNRGIDHENQTADQLHRVGDTQRKSMSLMFAPVNWEGEVLGVISVQSYRSHRYTEPDLELLCGFADQSAIALARILASEELQKSEIMYRGIVEDQSELIVRFDSELRLTFCNRSFTRTVGRASSGHQPLSFLEFLPIADHKRIRLLLTLIKPQNPTIDVEHSLMGADMETLRLLWTYRGIFGENGELLQYQAVGVDVTRLRLAESALARSEQRLELIVRQIPALLYTTDDQLNVTSVLGRFASMGCDSVTDASASDLIGKAVREVISGDMGDAELVEQVHRSTLDNGVASSFTLSCKDRHYHATVQPLRRSEGVIIGVVGIVLDVTERHESEMKQRQLQDELHANEKLAMIGRAMASIGHCMKNMITGLNGGMFLVDRCCDAADSVNPMLVQAQDLLRRSTARISLLLLNMLDLSKDRQPTFVQTNVGDLIDEVAAMLRTSAMAEGIEIKTCVDEAAQTFFVDPDRLYRALLNLGLNALDALCGSGRLQIAAKLAPASEINDLFRDSHPAPADTAVRSRFESASNLSDSQVGPVLRIDVIDTGTGMTPEVLDHLFEPFFSTKFSRGTGLGLAATLQFIQTHGGQILVRSAPHQGTTFTLLLPHHEASAEQIADNALEQEEL